MVSISDAAVEKAKEILKMEGKADHGFRFYTAGSGCCGPSYGIDLVANPEQDDQVIEKEGLKVFVDKAASESLNGMEIHYVEEDDKQGFVLTGGQPPSCGPSCGSSCG